MNWKINFSNIINQIKKNIISFLIYLGYGMKKADTEILSQNHSDDILDCGVNQTIRDKRVAKHLLNGEVTQEVIDLRYMDYLVSEKCRNYVYNGVGARKNDMQYKTVNFKFENKQMCQNVLDTLNDKHEVKYTINIIYDNIPKFRLEKYCKEVGVFDNSICLKFYMYGDKYEVTSLAFINNLKKLKNIRYHDFVHINNLTFITQNIKSVKNLLKYQYNDLTLLDIVIDDKKKEILLYYSYENLNIEDLTEKFYSEEQDKRYKNKEQKIDNNLLIY